MDSVYYQTVLLPKGRFADMATDQNARNQYDNALRKHGQSGWRAYHVAETEAGLLIFMQRVDRVGNGP